MNITTQHGLLYLDGRQLDVQEADSIAINCYGYHCAEQLVRCLEKDPRPPLSIQESLARQEEYARNRLNKNIQPFCIVYHNDFSEHVPPDCYRILAPEELDKSWVKSGLMWCSTVEDSTGVRTMWEINRDEKGYGIYLEPGHLYAVPV